MEELIKQLTKEIAVHNSLIALQIIFQNSYYFLEERKPEFESDFKEYIKRVISVADDLKSHLASTFNNLS